MADNDDCDHKNRSGGHPKKVRGTWFIMVRCTKCGEEFVVRQMTDDDFKGHRRRH